jgi:glycerophosphoryl diester phosphodiesterase
MSRPDVVRANRRAGLETHVWTVNTEADMAACSTMASTTSSPTDPNSYGKLMDQRAELSDPQLLLLALGRRLRE